MEYFGPKHGSSGQKYISQTPPVKVLPRKTIKNHVKEEVKLIDHTVLSNTVIIAENNNKKGSDFVPKDGSTTKIYSEMEENIKVWTTSTFQNEQPTSSIGPTVFYSPHSQSEVSFIAVSFQFSV